MQKHQRTWKGINKHLAILCMASCLQTAVAGGVSSTATFAATSQDATKTVPAGSSVDTTSSAAASNGSQAPTGSTADATNGAGAGSATAIPPSSISSKPAAAVDKTDGNFGDESSTPMPKMLWKPGQGALSTETGTEDIVATYDIDLARRQVEAYPDSPEAAFILGVALTRTSRVEEALKAVQHAKKLADSKGGPAYFDKMISSYEQMLVNYPNDNRVRYGLAWAYYMKAYLLGRYSAKVAAWKAANPPVLSGSGATATGVGAPHGANGTAAGGSGQTTTESNPGALSARRVTGVAGANVNVASTANATNTAANATNTAANTSNAAAKATIPLVKNSDIVNALSGHANPSDLLRNLAPAVAALASHQKLPPSSIPHIPTALEKADPADVPQIKHFYELALQKLDEIVQREPDDVWTLVYRAHLQAEYSGDLDRAMATWHEIMAKHPNNPAPYFFLGEGYLRQGDLQKSIEHVSKAIALRSLGN